MGNLSMRKQIVERIKEVEVRIVDLKAKKDEFTRLAIAEDDFRLHQRASKVENEIIGLLKVLDSNQAILNYLDGVNVYEN